MTVDENGNLVFPEATEQQQEQVGARFEAWILGRERELNPGQEPCLRTVGSQLRANADTWDEFTAGHFAFPPFPLMGGMREALRVFGGAEPHYRNRSSQLKRSMRLGFSRWIGAYPTAGHRRRRLIAKAHHLR